MSCKLNPDSCKATYQVKINALNQLEKEIHDKIKKYNNDLAVIKKLQDFCSKKEFYEYHTDNQVYLKFGKDKNNALIALYFNIESFINKIGSLHNETVYVFSVDAETARSKDTMLHMRYQPPWSPGFKTPIATKELSEPREDWAGVNINNFISENPKKGHGSFILNHLENIIKIVNSKIVNLPAEDNEKYSEIKFIGGTVFPQGIPLNNLVKFYNKNGLPTFNEGTGQNLSIYKEIEYFF